MKKPLTYLFVALATVWWTGCGALNAISQSPSNTVEQSNVSNMPAAYRTNQPVGPAKLYPTSDHAVNPACDIHDSINFVTLDELGLVALVEHRLTEPAACDYHAVSNQRYYALELTRVGDCGSVTYEGIRETTNGQWILKVIDNTWNLCSNRLPHFEVYETSPDQNVNTGVTLD